MVTLVLSLAFAGGADWYARSEDNDERVVSDNVGSKEKGNLPGSANASESENVKAVAETPEVNLKGKDEKRGNVTPVVHPKVVESLDIGNGVSIQLAGKLQNYYWGNDSGSDPDIWSPKSVNIHPSGKIMLTLWKEERRWSIPCPI